MPEKLVRDKIPDIIRTGGQEPTVRVAHGDELDYLMRAKVVEEAGELLSSGSSDEIVDILEIIDALLELRSVDPSTIDDKMRRKREERGGFRRGFVLTMEDGSKID
ncbi:MAG: nucleoside triphosphate pyrophosphohydrolase [Candidatus Thorarchaeota archaeon]